MTDKKEATETVTTDVDTEFVASMTMGTPQDHGILLFTGGIVLDTNGNVVDLAVFPTTLDGKLFGYDTDGMPEGRQEFYVYSDGHLTLPDMISVSNDGTQLTVGLDNGTRLEGTPLTKSGDDPCDVIAKWLLHTSHSRANIPALEGIKPLTHYVPNAKTTQVLTDPRLFEGVALLDVGRKRGQLTIEFGLSLADEEPTASIETTEPLDREDVRVIASVVTLKNAGNATVSPFQIADTMGYSNPSPELQEEIHGRVMKLRRVDGRIDWTEQARRYGIVDPDTGKPFERAEITGHLIDCNVFDGTDVDGHRYIRYQLLSDPITYQHAHQLGQVIDYPQELLGVKPVNEDGRRKQRVTREQTQIADAVLKFVYGVKNPRSKLGDSIRYDTLFEHAGVDVTHPKKRQRAVVFVNDYLRALQQEDVIKGFQVVTQGASHKPVSVRIAVVTKRGRR